MDFNKVNVNCKDPLAYQHTNKRFRYGDIPKENLTKKYKSLKVPPPPKLNENKIFQFSGKK
jgi:hypothetical protein